VRRWLEAVDFIEELLDDLIKIRIRQTPRSIRGMGLPERTQPAPRCNSTFSGPFAFHPLSIFSVNVYWTELSSWPPTLINSAGLPLMRVPHILAGPHVALGAMLSAILRPTGMSSMASVNGLCSPFISRSMIFCSSALMLTEPLGLPAGLPDLPGLKGVPTGRPSGLFAADTPLFLATRHYAHIFVAL
jgi:hypothetical protein